MYDTFEKITYIDAADGRLEFHFKENGIEKVHASSSPTVIGKMIKHIGLADTVMASSALDFASEYGFKNDGDARKLLNLGFKQAGI
jgi:hypothetical protein